MKTRYFLQLLMLSALWGTSFVLIRITAPIMGPNMVALLRVAFATVTLCVILAFARERWPMKDMKELAVLGIFAVTLPFVLYSWSAMNLPAGYIALLNTLAVPFSVLASVWLKEDKLSPRIVAGCILGFVGVALIVHLGPVTPTPQVIAAAFLAVGAGASVGLSSPFMKRATTRISPLSIAFGIHLFSLPFLLPGAAITWPRTQFTPAAMAAVMVMGIVTSGLAYWVNLRILSKVSPVAMMSSLFIIPMFGVTWGWLFLNEPLGLGMVFGAGLVLVAMGLVTGFNPLRKLTAVASD